MKQILALFAAALILTACGEEDSKQQQTRQNAPPRVNIPLAEDQGDPNAGMSPGGDMEGELAPTGDIPEEKLPDLSGLEGVERELFVKTVQIQIPYYEALAQWADEAEQVTEGKEAAASLRRYIALQESFGRRMQKLDRQFTGQLDPNYTGSEEFSRVLDEYMNDPELLASTEKIMGAYMGLIQRFRDDPACKEVFADIERMARESQPPQ